MPRRSSGDLRSDGDIDECPAQASAGCVMHFAALAYVGRIGRSTEQYYQNNVIGR
jgi:UDP-glucose 4-epimerase